MPIIRTLAVVAALAAASPAFAQSPFDGTWKADMTSVNVDAKPDQVTLAKGTCACASCTPAYSITADGKFHPVAGHVGYDEKSVDVLSASSVRLTNRRAGKVVAVATWTVSPDGNTLNQSFASTDTANGQTINGTASETRLAAAPAGAHPVSGSWAAAPATQLSDNAITATIRMSGKSLTMSFPTGEAFTAVLGGPFVPVVGDHNGQMAAARMTGPRTLELSYKHRGVVDEVDTITAAPAGDTVTMVSLDKRGGSTSTITMHRQ